MNLRGGEVLFNDVHVVLDEGFFVFPYGGNNEGVVTLGKRISMNELFPGKSTLSLSTKDDIGLLVKGAVMSCNEGCYIDGDGEYKNPNGLVFQYIEYYKYVDKLESEYHAYYFQPNTKVLFQFHGKKDDFFHYKKIIASAKINKNR